MKRYSNFIKAFIDRFTTEEPNLRVNTVDTIGRYVGIHTSNGIELFEQRIEVAGSRTFYGYATPGSLETDAVWRIYAIDVVGTKTHRHFALSSSVQHQGFIHQWSNKENLFPAVPFLNEFSLQLTGITNATVVVPFGLADPIVNFDRTDPFSIMIYWKGSDAGAYRLVNKTNGLNNGYDIQTDSSGRIIFIFRGSGTGDRIQIRTDAFTDVFDGNWHQLIVTKAGGSSDASDVILYIDGQSHKAPGEGGDEDFLIQDDDLTTGPTSASTDLAIGCRNSLANRFIGNIDECAFWNQELTEDEAEEIYNSGNGAIDLENGSGQIASALLAWWRFGDGEYVPANFPTIPDEIGAADATLGSAITPGDIETVVP